LKEGSRVYILSAFKRHRNRDAREELGILMQKGFSRIYVSPHSVLQKENPVKEGKIYRIEELLDEKNAEFI
jgi:excinuclease ABC subunit A